jgi:hypothetical protein
MICFCNKSFNIILKFSRNVHKLIHFPNLFEQTRTKLLIPKLKRLQLTSEGRISFIARIRTSMPSIFQQEC